MKEELEKLNKKKEKLYQNYLKKQVENGIGEYAEAVQIIEEKKNQQDLDIANYDIN